MNHNSIGRGYETFGNATAETVTRKLDERSYERMVSSLAAAGTLFHGRIATALIILRPAHSQP